jgi:glycosyltransferase involved in cell wall biosynthesis
MRILYFSRSYTTHDRRFLAELAASSHEIWYLRLEDEIVSYESQAVPEGVRTLPPLGGGERVPTPELWIRLAPRLEAVLHEVQPDLVHAGPVQSCAFLTALIGFHPLLVMSWGSDLLADAGRDEFWTWMTRYALRRADTLITDCDAVSRAACQIGGVEWKRIVQFPWGVDPAVFRPGMDTLGMRRRPGWENGVIAISTRSWEPNYGVIHLLESFRLAHDRDPRLRLVLLGDGSQRSEVERLISSWGLAKAVWLPGAVDHEQLPQYFRAADLYASFANIDGSSISLLEAMATGLPVIATDSASNREWIGDSANGLVVPAGDIQAMAAALVEMASMTVDRRRMTAVRNRAIIEQRADWKRNVRKLLDAYDRFLGEEVRVCHSSA